MPFIKGQTAWNKGFIGFRKGHPFYGKKQHTEETKRKMSLASIGKPKSDAMREKLRDFNLGKIHSMKTRKKISDHQRGYQIEETRKKISETMRGRKLSAEHKLALSINKINNPPHVFKDTSIELKIEAELRNRFIVYTKQFPAKNIARVDFYLPEYNVIIECDGDYWHNLPHQKIRDGINTKLLQENGFTLFRFWEHEINESPEKCIDKVFR